MIIFTIRISYADILHAGRYLAVAVCNINRFASGVAKKLRLRIIIRVKMKKIIKKNKKHSSFSW